jgi:hypothetical protein
VARLDPWALPVTIAPQPGIVPGGRSWLWTMMVDLFP